MRAAGRDLTPSQFGVSLENGLNISVYDRLTTGATGNAKSAGEKLKEKLSATATDGPRVQPVGEKERNNAARPTLVCAQCTNGAMEALRLSHSAFLTRLSNSLGELQSISLEREDPSFAKPTKPLTEKDVATVLEQMGLSKILKHAMILSSIDETRVPAKKRKKNHFSDFKGTQEELVAEQETLLAETAHRVHVKHDQQLSGKSEKYMLP